MAPLEELIFKDDIEIGKLLNNKHENNDEKCYSSRSSFKIDKCDCQAKNTELSEDVSEEYDTINEGSHTKSFTFSSTSSPSS